jgi:hypothetical protein
MTDVFILTKQNNNSQQSKNLQYALSFNFGGLVIIRQYKKYSEDEMHTYLSLFPKKDKKIKQ